MILFAVRGHLTFTKTGCERTLSGSAEFPTKPVMMRVFRPLSAALLMSCALLFSGGCGYRAAVAAERYLERGAEALQAGDQASAGRYFEKARELDSSPQLLARVGLAYAGVERCPDAIPLLVESLEKLPGQPSEVRLALFECYERGGDSEKAGQVLEDSLKVYRDDAGALNNLGYSAADEGVHLDLALRMVARAAKLRPRNGYIVDSLGWTYYRLGELARAREILRRAIKLQPDAEILYHLGVVSGAMGDTEEAVGYLREALKRDPGFHPAREALLRLGR
jgi:tetratricopeptide (TPR) repeat protein